MRYLKVCAEGGRTTSGQDGIFESSNACSAAILFFVRKGKLLVKPIILLAQSYSIRVLSSCVSYTKLSNGEGP
jgi:hypothetical protein